ncbi:DoxX family protein [Streptomyces sp. NA04227]|uniref:DoxX family protein n=1 Tax=Streptomyces sp. NA04227 TaxID=2742136 RepID=UPI0015926F71|nr:DoxX family protein [Streptomyces sp. NA04227]QKW09670.1 DoxX family protein [Streptomyces sp. NA04227]
MTTAQITLAVALSLVLVPLGLGKIAAVPFMRRAAAHLDMPPGLYRVVGALEVAGAVGLLLGPASAPLGMAAGIGLALLMTAAAVVHLRHGDPPVRALPAAVLALTAVAYAGATVAAD